MHISINAFLLHLLKCKQDSSIIFYHSQAVAIFSVKWKHHANANCVRNRRIGCYRLFRSIAYCVAFRFGCIFLITTFCIRHKNPITLFKLISFLLHFRVCIDKLLYADTVLFSYAKDCFLLFHLMKVSPYRSLCNDVDRENQNN